MWFSHHVMKYLHGSFAEEGAHLPDHVHSSSAVSNAVPRLSPGLSHLTD